MASFTFNIPPQHKHLFFSFSLCKCPSYSTSLKFNNLCHFLLPPPPKHTLPPTVPQNFVYRGGVRHIHAKLYAENPETSTKTLNTNTRKGHNSLTAGDEGVQRNSLENHFGSVLNEKRAAERLAKDNDPRNMENLRFKRGREMGPGNSSVRLKDENWAMKSETNLAVSKREEKNNKKDGNGVLGEKKVEEPSKKKSKADSPGKTLRVELDMCSKRGDAMGAIQLYDKALREGIKIGQYHYAVLLYLCSSAAMGVVQPAKSGTGSRTLNALNVSSETSNVNSVELSESIDKDNKSSSVSELSDHLSNNGKLVNSGSIVQDKMELEVNNLDNSFDEKEKVTQFSNWPVKPYSQLLDGLVDRQEGDIDHSHEGDGSRSEKEDCGILVTEDVRGYSLHRGFEICEMMCMDNVPMNEAILTSVARMAMSMGNGDMAFDMVKQMKALGINPRLRSYGPALFAFCKSGDIEKAFAVEKHMLEHGVIPEEPELKALLKISVEAGKGDKVYYVLHKLRTTVRKVSPSSADTIVKWFESKAASRMGKLKLQQSKIREAIENGGGGWHGQGWLGKGRWTITRTTVGADALCKGCGEKLALIDLDPLETEKFAKSVASLAIKRQKKFSFQKFQKWLDCYGPFEAVIDAANVGLFSQKGFSTLKVNAVVNKIRKKLLSRKWPLIVLHNRHITEQMTDKPVNRAIIEKWKTADVLYATPSGSNDDWYWLYAAIKSKCLLVTNDEMRDHTFQLLGNDIFPKWKERHQVRFSFSDAGPVLHMPPPFSVVIQESEKGYWHIPIACELEFETKREWLCIIRDNTEVVGQASATMPEAVQPPNHNHGRPASTTQTKVPQKSLPKIDGKQEKAPKPNKEIYKNIRHILSGLQFSNRVTVLSQQIEAAEKQGNCIIDFQI
ncbi:hypothetical protein SLE2022_267200 [Rubroshorea leprosula]